MPSLFLIIDVVCAALFAIFVIDAVKAWFDSGNLSPKPTTWERLLYVGYGSATILWGRFVSIVTAGSQALAWVADIAGQPNISNAIKSVLQPQYVAFFVLGVLVINEVARRRTLGASNPKFGRGRRC